VADADGQPAEKRGVLGQLVGGGEGIAQVEQRLVVVAGAVEGHGQDVAHLDLEAQVPATLGLREGLPQHLDGLAPPPQVGERPAAEPEVACPRQPARRLVGQPLERIPRRGSTQGSFGRVEHELGGGIGDAGSVVEEVADGQLEPVGHDRERAQRDAAAPQLDQTQERAREVFAAELGQAEPALEPGRADAAPDIGAN